MRSYKAARGYFSFVEVMVSLLIIIGIVIAFIAFAGAAEASNPVVLMAAVPGVALAGFGFFALVYIQASRATVDCAEYAQQSLKLARNQYEVSKQLLKLAEAQHSANGYETLTNNDDLQEVSFDTDTSAKLQPDVRSKTELDVAIQSDGAEPENRAIDRLSRDKIAISHEQPLSHKLGVKAARVFSSGRN